MNKSLLYTLNGPVQAGDGVYIERQADPELLKLCKAGMFAYVLAPRQIGKSSLMAATARKLEEEGICPIVVDLTSIGTYVDSAEQWYLSFLQVIGQRLPLKTHISTWWQDHTEFSLPHRLISFFQEVVLREVSGPVVVFVDEIDSTLSLPFSRDDFFAAIRAMNNTRADAQEFRRLTFVLIGTATPSELIADPTRTPFNIGQRVELADFTFDEAVRLADGLGMNTVEDRENALRRILTWTGGQPYLTQGLCDKVSRTHGNMYSQDEIDHLVAETYLDEKGKQDVHFQFMRDMLTRRVVDSVGVLTIYRNILHGQRVPDDVKSQLQAYLKLSGVVKAVNGLLRVRNPIYARVFDQRWVREQLPSLRKWYGSLPPQRKAMVAVGVPSFFVMLFLCVLTMFSILWAMGTSTQLQQAKTQVQQVEGTRQVAETQAQQFGLRSTQVAMDVTSLSVYAVQLQATAAAANTQIAQATPMSVDHSALPTKTPLPPAACVLTITNSLVPLMSEPDQFSIEMIRVPLGEYSTLEYKEIPFAGNMQGWFQIQVGERTGWVKNDTWTIAAKNNACP